MKVEFEFLVIKVKRSERTIDGMSHKISEISTRIRIRIQKAIEFRSGTLILDIVCLLGYPDNSIGSSCGRVINHCSSLYAQGCGHDTL